MPIATTSLIEAYHQSIQKHGFLVNPSQVAAVEQLQELIDRLESDKPSLLAKAYRSLASLLGKRTAATCKGVYLWGGVGAGKTFVMDLFYKTLNTSKKERMHFYRFMEEVHKMLKESRGRSNPMEYVAQCFAQRAAVICIDEFHITNIADAMIMHQFLEGLLHRGTVLVATSNIVPDKLYQGGLQYERFAPAIALIKAYNETVCIDSEQDYRVRHMQKDGMYFYPHTTAIDEMLSEDYFSGVQSIDCIEVNQREITVKNATALTAWFEFSQLCDGHRSVKDYIEIADRYEIVIVSDVPNFRSSDDVVRRFIHLVDELYDRRVDLIISAASDVDKLYQKGRLAGMFERTQSRLKEMQSEGYLKHSRYAEDHLPS